MDKFLQWQKQDDSGGKRVLALLIGALIFPIAIPSILVLLLPQVDAYCGIGRLSFGPGNLIIGVLAVVLGGALALWTIVIQITLASGTPFPMLPTRKLLVLGPFKYCRNPMTLGTIVAYAGAAVWIGSFSALLAVAVLAALLIGYLKIIEEKELQLRFGEAYTEYKMKTPFILPIKIGKTGKVRIKQER